MAHEIISESEIKVLAHRLASADYDSVHQFLENLGDNLLSDSVKDRKRGRRGLAINLQAVSYRIKNAAEDMRIIAGQCRPYNEKQNEAS